MPSIKGSLLVVVVVVVVVVKTVLTRHYCEKAADPL